MSAYRLVIILWVWKSNIMERTKGKHCPKKLIPEFKGGGPHGVNS